MTEITCLIERLEKLKADNCIADEYKETAELAIKLVNKLQLEQKANKSVQVRAAHRPPLTYSDIHEAITAYYASDKNILKASRVIGIDKSAVKNRLKRFDKDWKTLLSDDFEKLFFLIKESAQHVEHKEKGKEAISQMLEYVAIECADNDFVETKKIIEDINYLLNEAVQEQSNSDAIIDRVKIILNHLHYLLKDLPEKNEIFQIIGIISNNDEALRIMKKVSSPDFVI